MNMYTASLVSALAASSLLSGPALAADGCDPTVASSETRYPANAQHRQQTGAVHLEVLVDETGQARSARITDSSGYRLLDRAALQGVLNHWRFDVSSCERSDLPVSDLVAVEYRG